MTSTELEALVQKLALHGCRLLVEYDGYDYRASAVGAMAGEQSRGAVIQATSLTLDAALVILAEAAEKAEWINETEAVPCSSGS